MILYLLGAVGIAVLGWIAGKYLYKADTDVEDRRRAAIKISSSMKEKGLHKTAEFLEDYAVGDYSGMAKKLKDLAVTFSNPAAVSAEFDVVFEKILTSKLNTPEGLAALTKLVEGKKPPSA